MLLNFKQILEDSKRFIDQPQFGIGLLKQTNINFEDTLNKIKPLVEKLQDIKSKFSREIIVENQPIKQENFENYPELSIGNIKHKPKETKKEYLPIIEKISQKQNIEPALLKAILMTESHMGELKNKNAVGDFGWLTGLMPSALNELKRLDIPVNLKTIEGAIDTTAKYWNIVAPRKGVDSKNPIEVYTKNYETSNNPNVKKIFGYYYNAYKSVLKK